MHHTKPTQRCGLAPANDQGGVALVMALIFSILLYILVAELTVASSMVRATGENDALLARMRTQMEYQLSDAEDQLLGDMAGQAADDEGGGGGGLPGGGLAGALPGGAGGAAGDEEGAEDDPASRCDSSRDGWFEPVGHADNDLTTYVWIEDENRKFNILSIWSEDQEYADRSRERLVRIIDVLREDTQFDVSSGDASQIVQQLVDWGQRPSTDQMPTPLLKSADAKRRDLVLPLHLDELLLLRAVTEDLFFDKVLDGRYYPGLESVLTIWTSLRPDPGDPEKLARQQAAAAARGETPASGAQGGDQGGAGQPGGAGAGAGASGDEDEPPQPEGLGIKININTASRAVLRGVLEPSRVPDRVVDAIIEWRNELDEEATTKAQEDGSSQSDFGELDLGDRPLYKFFETIADLDQIEEYKQLSDEVKADFDSMFSTKSEVFSIHLATLFKRSEENRIYLLRRARSTVMRIDDGADGQIVPLVPFEERVGLRLMPVDLQDDQQLDLSQKYSEMDQFAQEERAWNPFLIDFYLPQERREEFYTPQGR